MQHLLGDVSRYHGIDVSQAAIDANVDRFGDSRVSFQHLDLSDPSDQASLELSQVDLVVCLDVFGHLLNSEVDSLLAFLIEELCPTYVLVTNRRDGDAQDYLSNAKTRHQGIDLEVHPQMIAAEPERLWSIPALYEGDSFDLYRFFGSSRG